MTSPNRYIVGQTAFLRVRISDPATGDPDDPATQDPVDDPTIVLTVYAPDGTTQTPSLAHASTGVYTTSVALDQQGRWTYADESNGPGDGAGMGRIYVSPVP